MSFKSKGNMSGTKDKALSEEAKTRMVEKSAKGKVILKAKAIISKHFNEAIKDKEVEIKSINAAIVEAQTSLHLIRYGAVSKTYATYKATAASTDSLHPEVKSLVSGKRPLKSEVQESSLSGLATTTSKPESVKDTIAKAVQEGAAAADADAASIGDTVSPEDLPGYVAPLAKKNDSDCSMAEPRGHQHKVKRRLVIGNVSKWIECDEREDSATHKWMLYVRGCKEFPDVSDVVKKVRFFIHQTYHPNNVIDVSMKPFHLIRRGWGEFPARIQIHFKNPAANKPVDVVHNLKLDKTYTGLQTLGAETLIDVWLKKDVKSLNEAVKQEEEATMQTPSVEQNFTIVEDMSMMITDPTATANRPPLKRTLSAAATTTAGSATVMEASNGSDGGGGGSESKKARLNDNLQNQQSPKNILKLKDMLHPIVRPAGASLLKKMH